MNYDSGKFKCPKCGNRTVQNFNYYLYREEYNNNILQKKWIFYKSEEKKWYCCRCCAGSLWEDICKASFFCLDSFNCNISVICLPCTSIVYILFFFWIDLIYYLCYMGKTYFGIEGKLSSNTKKNEINDKDLFNEIEGLTENEWNSKYKTWVCSKCKFQTKTFLEFIPNSGTKLIQYESESEVKYIKLDVKNNESERYENEFIAIRFVSDDQAINYSVLCKKSDLFKSIISQKLFVEYPNLKKQNCFYLCGNKLINQDKTCDENGIKTGNNIIIKVDVKKNKNDTHEDEFIAIHFSSVDQAINYSLPCKKSDLFKSIISKKLFVEYPNLKKQNNIYLCGGRLINQDKTCCENGIKSGDNILIQNFDESRLN